MQSASSSILGRSVFVLLSFLLASQVPLFCERHFWEALTEDGGYGGYSCSFKTLYESFFSPWAEPQALTLVMNFGLLFLYAGFFLFIFWLLQKLFLRCSK